MTDQRLGICSYGGYIPRLRLDRMAIYGSMGWFAPATIMVAQGERSMCNWDEDALTMAVAAAWDCVGDHDRSLVDACYLASTTLPFADRQNAGVVKAALNLGDEVLTADVTASQKAGTTALVAGLESIASGARRRALVTASDKRETKPTSFYEMWFGDGAASLLLGTGDDVIARFLGAYSVSHDFVPHYRGARRRFDYTWEERWVRDVGYSKIIPQAVTGLLDAQGLTIADIDRLIYPCFFKGEHRKIAKQLGADPAIVADTMHEVCGETGAAHPLVMLVRALEEAKAGDKILVASFGQGSDALLFEVTDAIADLAPRRGIGGSLERKKTIDSYPKFLEFRDLIDPERGIRAEVPTQTAMTVLWRKRKMLLGLVGGRCTACGTAQFPRSEICVNPECGAVNTQEDYELSQRPATVKTFTSDLLAPSVDPPAVYGMVQFEGGGRLLADFTDSDVDDIKVGAPVRMAFRRRYVDEERGFSGYFWKAIVEKMPEAPREIRFDDQVALVTGAGGGLGRAYALALAARGAKVVVNDLGGPADGLGDGSPRPADAVVEEIRAAGGEAVANYDSVSDVEGGRRMVEQAIETWGRIDIVIHNAGILRDRSLVKLEPTDWDAVLDVHLTGAYNVTRPALVHMREQGGGRIVLTTSAAGLYGNFGQSNYSAAKMGLVGFMNTVKLEGRKKDILINTVAPVAASRLTEGIFPSDVMERAKPEHVAALVLYLCSRECADTGLVLNAAPGAYNRAAVLTGPGAVVGEGGGVATPEQLLARWEEIDSLQGAREHDDAMSFVTSFIAATTEAPADDGGGGDRAGIGGELAKVFDEGIPRAFKADAAATSGDVVFGFDLTGEGGGQWWVEVKGGELSIGKGAHDAPTVGIVMSGADFLELVAGRLDAMAAYTTGKLKLTGEVMKSRLLMKLFAFGG